MKLIRPGVMRMSSFWVTLWSVLNGYIFSGSTACYESYDPVPEGIAPPGHALCVQRGVMGKNCRMPWRPCGAAWKIAVAKNVLEIVLRRMEVKEYKREFGYESAGNRAGWRLMLQLLDKVTLGCLAF